MISITKALNAAVKEYRIINGTYAVPVVTMPRCMLPALALAIEKDLGGRLYENSPHHGFKYNGIHFCPSPDEPFFSCLPEGKPYACEA